MNDAGSYENVSFEKLDTDRTTFLSEHAYREIEDSLRSVALDIHNKKLDIEYPDGSQNISKLKADVNKLQADSSALAKKQTDFAHNYVPHQTGWVLRHTYRAKNGFGALALHTTIFELNMNCDSVVDVIPNDN